jgi:hypothetical protein
MGKFLGRASLVVALLVVTEGATAVSSEPWQFTVGDSVLAFVTPDPVLGSVTDMKITVSSGGSIARVLVRGTSERYQSQSFTLTEAGTNLKYVWSGKVGERERLAGGTGETPCGLWKCTVAAVLDSEDRLIQIAVGAGYDVGGRYQGVVMDRSLGQESLGEIPYYKVDGFDISFTKITQVPSTGDVVVAGFTASSFDNEQRVIVGKISRAGRRWDPAFDGDGFAIIDLGIATSVEDIAVDASGSVYVLGTTRFTSNSTVLSFVRKLTSAGKVDKTYGLGGTAYPAGLVESRGVDLSMDNNSLSVLTTSYDAGNLLVPRVSKLKSTGALDSSFSGDGQVVAEWLSTPSPFGSGSASPFLIDANGTVALVRNSGQLGRLDVVRFTSTGEMDMEASGSPAAGRQIGAVVMTNQPTEIILRSVVGDVQSGAMYVSTSRISALGGAAVGGGPASVPATSTTVAANPSNAGGTAAPGATSPSTANGGGIGSSASTPVVAPPMGLVMRPLVRGLSVTWSGTADTSAGYVVTLADEDSTRQCVVAAGQKTSCTFRKLLPWKTYRAAVAATSNGVLSEALTDVSKPILSMRTLSSIATTRLIRPPRSISQGRRTWTARGACRLSPDKVRIITGRTKGVCLVTLATAASGKYPSTTRSVRVRIVQAKK